MRICFASNNQGKIQELREMLNGIHEVYGLHDLGITEDIPETGTTLQENSHIKASFVHHRHSVAVIADDSGLMVDALDGAPGVYSARFAGTPKDDQANMDLLLKRLNGEKNRSASFRTVITFIDESGKQRQFTGEVEGQIIHEKKGSGGFGYDPIFQPTGYDLTFAELGTEVKNRISHRAKAVKQLIAYLQQFNG